MCSVSIYHFIGCCSLDGLEKVTRSYQIVTMTACRKPTNVLLHSSDRVESPWTLQRCIYPCEPPAQCCVFLYTTFGSTLDDLARPKYPGYDCSCGGQYYSRDCEGHGGWNNPKYILTLNFQWFKKSMVITLSVLNKHSGGLTSSSSQPV